MAQSHGDAVYGIVSAVIRQSGNFATTIALDAEIQNRKNGELKNSVWQRISDDHSLESGSKYAVNTSAKSITLKLPATPTEGVPISICDDSKSFGVNKITIVCNGNTIEGLSEDMSVSETGAMFTMCYLGGTWRVY